MRMSTGQMITHNWEERRGHDAKIPQHTWENEEFQMDLVQIRGVLTSQDCDTGQDLRVV